MPHQEPAPSICIVSHNAYGAISGQKSGHIGGVEWQTSLTARWFAQRGYDVSMLTWNEGGPPEEVFQGIRVIKISPKKPGVKGVRFFHPKWTGLVRAMRRAGADLYYHNCGECVTGQIALWCRKNGRKFVFSSANDTDCDSRLPELRTPWDRWLYRYGLRQADAIVVQTETQRRLLQEGFGLGATVIPMPCAGLASDQAVSRTGEIPRRLLWIARVARQKRPDRLLELAAMCPDLGFDFVGPFSGAGGLPDEYAKAIKERAGTMANVVVHGAVQRDRLPDLYQRAALFCCTSDYEGFPNTFLEAWSYGLPIVSTFDPDGVIVRWNLGRVVKNMEEMAAAIRTLLAAPETYQQMSNNARRYYLDYHTVETVLPRFEQLFLATMAGRKQGSK
jgi:glycosyltransferase involved in cell wall biosynthesis